MKKLKYLLFLPIICLTSCSKEVYGNYSFAMGNVGGFRFGITATLSSEEYVFPTGSTSDHNKKKFNLEVEFPPEALNELVDPSQQAVFTLFEKLLENKSGDNKINVPGYYYVGNENALGKRINIGIPQVDEIFEEEISKKVIELVMVAYQKDKCLDLYIPVSEVDLQMQLTWYGYYISLKQPVRFYDLYEKFGSLPGEGGDSADHRDLRIGTIPTDKEVEEMNALISRYPSDFGDYTFRAHHLVDLTLTRK